MAFTSNSSSTQERLISLKDKCVNLLICVPLVLLILPVCLLFFSAMHLIRFLVKLMAKVFRPDLGNILSCGSAACALSKSTVEDTRLVIMVTGIYEGTLTVQQVKEFVSELFEIKNTDGKLQYPELMQFPISWLCYYFWCRDTNFHIDNHVHALELNKEIISKEELNDITSGLINESFKSDQSPWNITIVNNVSIGKHDQFVVQNKNTALILKFSHIIGDGYSIVKLFGRFGQVTKNNDIKLTYPATKKGFGEWILFPFKTLNILAEGIRDGFKSHPNYPLMVTKQRFPNALQGSDSVSVDDIKRIKRDLNVSFTSVVLALATGSIRALIIESGLILPKTIPCLVAILRPGHTSNLSNHYCTATIKLPIGELDHINRVRLCHLEFQQAKSSPEPFLSILTMSAFGGCVRALGRKVCPDAGIPVGLSYLPLDWSANDLAGCHLNSVFGCLTPYSTVGLSIGIVSFQDSLIFSAVFDSGIITEQTASNFGKYIKDEVGMFKDSDPKSKKNYKQTDIV